MGIVHILFYPFGAIGVFHRRISKNFIIYLSSIASSTPWKRNMWMIPNKPTCKVQYRAFHNSWEQPQRDLDTFFPPQRQREVHHWVISVPPCTCLYWPASLVCCSLLSVQLPRPGSAPALEWLLQLSVILSKSGHSGWNRSEARKY